MTQSSAQPTDRQYRIVRIPTTSAQLAVLITKYRDAKLAALFAEPAGFAVKHADEILLSPQIWAQRLAAPANIFVCVTLPQSESVPSGTDEEALMAGEWTGMVSLRGPLPWETYYIPETGQPVPEDPSFETRWHLHNLYTSSAHRGRGLAKRLVNACFDYATDQTKQQGLAKARIRLVFKEKGSFLGDMYRGMGFEEAGRFTLKEAYGCNGDQEHVPEDTSSTEELRGMWENRYGTAMERLIEVVQ